jgi:Family of unknown function (DUF6314)
VAAGGRLATRYGAAVSADQPGSDRAAVTGAAAGPGPDRRPAGSTLDYLIGDWNVDRRISDASSGRGGLFLGTASFELHGRAVRYAEHGELNFGAHRGPASRTLTYSGRDDGAADVRFADGREFFRLDLSSGRCQAEHRCGADRYQVTVTRLSKDSFTETWQVTGPAKDYVMTTAYRRAGTCSGQGAGSGPDRGSVPGTDPRPVSRAVPGTGSGPGGVVGSGGDLATASDLRAGGQ